MALACEGSWAPPRVSVSSLWLLLLPSQLGPAGRKPDSWDLSSSRAAHSLEGPDKRTAYQRPLVTSPFQQDILPETLPLKSRWRGMYGLIFSQCDLSTNRGTKAEETRAALLRQERQFSFLYRKSKTYQLKRNIICWFPYNGKFEHHNGARPFYLGFWILFISGNWLEINFCLSPFLFCLVQLSWTTSGWASALPRSRTSRVDSSCTSVNALPRRICFPTRQTRCPLLSLSFPWGSISH